VWWDCEVAAGVVRIRMKMSSMRANLRVLNLEMRIP